MPRFLPAAFTEGNLSQIPALAAGPQREAITALAARAGIAPKQILSYGSKQSANYTANVANRLGSARIAVSDTLLNQASTAELPDQMPVVWAQK